MNVDWLTWSNPVAIWWGFLLAVSVVNVALWLALFRFLPRRVLGGVLRVEVLVVLSAVYVFGCAFRSVLPRADVQRIALFDTWLSSVAVGRSVATVAELCYAIQWAIVLYALARSARSPFTRGVAGGIVPLIVVAEGCSWYAVITTNYLGNTLENSLWVATYLLIAIGLIPLLYRFTGALRALIAAALVGILGYAVFMFSVDIPMYVGRWQADLASGKELLGLFAGLHDAATRRVVTRDLAPWHNEIAWLSLYFSVAVWTSLMLCGFVLIRDRLPYYRRRLSGRSRSWRGLATPRAGARVAPARSVVRADPARGGHR